MITVMPLEGAAERPPGRIHRVLAAHELYLGRSRRCVRVLDRLGDRVFGPVGGEIQRVPRSGQLVQQ